MKRKTDHLKGTGVAVVTPFQKSGEIDFDSYEKIISHILHGEIEFVVVLGTTGEAAALTLEEKKKLVDFSIKRIDGRVPVVIGLGGNVTADVVHSFSQFLFSGVDAILSVCPYYNKPNQEGIYQHFKAISEASPVPVILYNVPGRTSSTINASTCLRLANDCSNIIGIKEASGNFEQIYSILKNRPENFLVLSGDDALTLPLLAVGADGVISVVANAYPKEFSDMVRFGLSHSFDKALPLHYSLIDFINSLFIDGSPAGIKAALEIKHLCKNYLRLPLVSVKDEIYNKIKSLVELIG